MKLALLNEKAGKKPKFFAAVAVCQYRDEWLLGLAKDTGDDRSGKWICPGGGIKPGESPEAAAVRECREETGVKCEAVGKAFTLPDKAGVAFVHCKASSKKKLKPNHEFAALGFFDRKDLKGLKIYHNVKELIERCK